MFAHIHHAIAIWNHSANTSTRVHTWWSCHYYDVWTPPSNMVTHRSLALTLYTAIHAQCNSGVVHHLSCWFGCRWTMQRYVLLHNYFVTFNEHIELGTFVVQSVCRMCWFQLEHVVHSVIFVCVSINKYTCGNAAAHCNVSALNDVQWSSCKWLHEAYPYVCKQCKLCIVDRNVLMQCVHISQTDSK